MEELGSPGGSNGKESACNPGDLGLIAGSGRSPGEGNGYPLQYSCLENSTELGGPKVHGHKEPNMTERPTLLLFTDSMWTFISKM